MSLIFSRQQETQLMVLKEIENKGVVAHYEFIPESCSLVFRKMVVDRKDLKGFSQYREITKYKNIIEKDRNFISYKKEMLCLPKLFQEVINKKSKLVDCGKIKASADEFFENRFLIAIDEFETYITLVTLDDKEFINVTFWKDGVPQEKLYELTWDLNHFHMLVKEHVKMLSLFGKQPKEK